VTGEIRTPDPLVRSQAIASRRERPKSLFRHRQASLSFSHSLFEAAPKLFQAHRNRLANSHYLAFRAARCFFFALSLTDFVRTGFIPSRLSRANNAPSDSFLLATFHAEERASNSRLLILFFSEVSAAKNFRFPCGSFRALPANRMHDFPTATPHLGQGTDNICLRVSFFSFFLVFSIPASVALGSRTSAVVVSKAETMCRAYDFLTDMGRFCRKSMTSALFTCKPPL
jgi:hypothetical protein